MVSMPRFIDIEGLGEKESYDVLGSGAGLPRVDICVPSSCMRY